jgi:hypothetical protein
MVNSLKKAFDDRNLLEMRGQLARLVKLFGYDAVRKELSEVKRWDAEAKARPSADDAKRRDGERYDQLVSLWLKVESIRRETKGLTAKDACRELAAAGGVTELASGAPDLGISVRVVHRVPNFETLYREYKRAERLRKSDPAIGAAWEQALPPGGKTDEK